MANPNPVRISDPMWRLWEEFKAFEPLAKLGGIYADKPGYHNFRNDLPKTDYSVEDLAADRLGPGDKASAWDLTLPADKMKLYSKRLADACKRRDPRLFRDGQPVIREFIGTLDGSTVYCYVLVGGKPLGVKDANGNPADSGPDPGRDSSHLWHVHISLIRKFINDWQAISGILSILKGESLTDWSNMALTNDDLKKIGLTVATWDYRNGDGVEEAYKVALRAADNAQEANTAVKALSEKVDKILAAPPGTVTISDEQLERVLRKVIGSVDGIQPAA